MRTALWIACFVFAASCLAQAQETQFQAELRIEKEHVKEDCSSIQKAPACGATLVTDHPLHVALGSIAPQNGFGFGPALVTHMTPGENWRINWNSDAVFAPGGGWRAGTYLKSVRTAVQLPQVARPGAAPPRPISIYEYPVFNVYAQAISLPTLTFFGIGPASSRADKTSYGMTEGIIGGSAIVPIRGGVARSLGLSVLLELNGRMFDIRSGQSDDVPSITTRFSDATAPGLSTQPTFAQFGEGIRLKPSLFNSRLNLSYVAQVQQFVAPSASSDSFQRWTVDLNHEVPIYRTRAPEMSRDTNGPNQCATGPTEDKCPPITRDRWGTASVRFLLSKSVVGDGSVVPFYLQRTLGGSDINGIRSLASYDDYRFRGPHILLFQESVEHSIWGPIGVFLSAEQGRVALQREPLNFDNILHSFGVGVTLRAGGFPAVTASWAKGGSEGHHIAFTIDTSLLGGGGRPSLH